jgi:DNA-binding NarL/FixJ family response regulator
LPELGEIRVNLKRESIEMPFANLCSEVSRFLQGSRKVMESDILLIDDSAIFRKTVKNLLASSLPSVSIEEASDAKEAFGKIDERLPRLIFMDIRLPDKSGLELTREIKDLHPSVTIVMLSGYDSQETQEVALAGGASLFLSKGSVTSKEIVEVAESVLFPNGQE